jgi:NAD(P)-dependent dehydrogenase (short-subunit alcohol dehydrogenase family)
MEPTNNVALVTGGGSGIGRASALALVDVGWSVVVCGRRLSALKETVALSPVPGKLQAIKCDVTDGTSVQNLFAAIDQQFGRLDLVFNNAGINVPAAVIDELPVDDFKRVIEVNLTGAFAIAQGAFRMMRHQNPQGGRIINNGSVSAYVPRPGAVAYTMSKHAVTGLTRTLSLDGRPFGIVCGQIDIGNATSDMTERMSGGVSQADGSCKSEPTMDVKHVADAVVQMASLPLSANVQFMTIMASSMPYIGRG